MVNCAIILFKHGCCCSQLEMDDDFKSLILWCTLCFLPWWLHKPSQKLPSLRLVLLKDEVFAVCVESTTLFMHKRNGKCKVGGVTAVPKGKKKNNQWNLVKFSGSWRAWSPRAIVGWMTWQQVGRGIAGVKGTGRKEGSPFSAFEQ